MRSRPSVTRRRRSSSSRTPAKEYCVEEGCSLEILFEPPGQGFEHAGAHGEFLALAGDDLLRGALDKLLVRELAAGALHLVLDARDLLFEACDLPTPELLAQHDLDHDVSSCRQRRLGRAVERLDGFNAGQRAEHLEINVPRDASLELAFDLRFRPEGPHGRD